MNAGDDGADIDEEEEAAIALSRRGAGLPDIDNSLGRLGRTGEFGGLGSLGDFGRLGLGDADRNADDFSYLNGLRIDRSQNIVKGKSFEDAYEKGKEPEDDDDDMVYSYLVETNGQLVKAMIIPGGTLVRTPTGVVPIPPGGPYLYTEGGDLSDEARDSIVAQYKKERELKRKRTVSPKFSEMEKTDNFEEDEPEEVEGKGKERVGAYRPSPSPTSTTTTTTTTPSLPFLKNINDNSNNSNNQSSNRVGEISTINKNEREIGQELGGTNKQVHQGKQYDFVVPVNVGGGSPRFLAFNRNDDPAVVAQNFLSAEGLDQAKQPKIISYINQLLAQPQTQQQPTTQTQTQTQTQSPKRTLSTSETQMQSQSFPKRTQTENNKTRTALSFLQQLREQLEKERAQPPPKEGKHMPKKRECPVLYRTGQMEGITKKLHQFNAEILANPKQKHLGLGREELGLLDKMLTTIKDTSAYNTSIFLDSEYRLVSRLLLWPTDKLFPVLDVVRLLILHPRAAEYYGGEGATTLLPKLLELHEGWGSTPLLPNIMILLKVAVNMFAYPPLEKLADKYALLIMEIAASCTSNPDHRIRSEVANLMLNFSSLLSSAPSLTESKVAAIAIIKKMLTEEKDVEAIYALLVALGTLAYGNRDTTDFVASLSIVQEIQKYLESPEAKISEAAKELLQLLQW